MSNRFHNKWHRRNHHTYGNPTNPDAGHDPIASQEQPFLGEFILNGTLSAWAPLSSYAGGFFSNNTSICAVAGYRGLLVHAPRVGIEVRSNSLAISAHAQRLGMSIASPYTNGRAISATANYLGIDVYSNNVAISARGDRIAIEALSRVRAISAYGGFVAGEFNSNNRAISAYSPIIGIDVGSANVAISAQGSRIGIEVFSPNRALSAYGRNIALEAYSDFIAISAFSDKTGLEVYSNNRAISAFSTTVGAYIYSSLTGIQTDGRQVAGMFSSPTVSLSTGGGGYNELNSRTGIYCIPTDKNVVGTPFSPVLAVKGNSYFDGGVTITGDLSTLGSMSYLDTKVVITSSFYVENKGTDAAATIIQTGAQPILVCYDKDETLTIPSFIVDGAKQGNVGINVSSPSERLTINGNISGYNNQVSLNQGNATGEWTAAFGNSQASNDFSFAEGYGSLASGLVSKAAGYKATASNNYSYIWSGDSTLGSNINTSRDGQYTIYQGSSSNIYMPRGRVSIGVDDNQSNALTVMGTLSVNGTTYIYGDNKMQYGYFPSINDGGQIFFEYSDNADYGRFIIQTIDNADSSIVLRQWEQPSEGQGEVAYNRLKVGTDGNVGVGMGVLTAIQTFPSTLTVFGNISSSNNIYPGNQIIFGTLPSSQDTNLYRSAPNTLKTDDNLKVDSNLTILGNTSLSGRLLVGQAVSATTVSQAASSHPTFTGTTINVDLNGATYQIIPIALNNTTINFGGFAPGRTNFVLLSSIATTNLTINPTPNNLIYMDGRPTTLTNTRVMLFEIMTFGSSVSSTIVKTKTWP